MLFLHPEAPFAQRMGEGTAGFNADVNAVSYAKSRYPMVRGQGIVICLKEQAPDPANIDLRGRLAGSSLVSPVTTPHATQMATLMVGVGNSSPIGEGVAPKSTLISASFGRLLPESDAFYRTNHIAVVNHSYGTTIENFYGEGAVAYDESTGRLPTLLHIFSAGNLGYVSNQTGPYRELPTVATLTGNFKMSKNSLTVGATGADGTVLASSSRGPAHDGRLKPELVAYSEEGSSGAAALTSGVTALLQQAFRQKHNGSDPMAEPPAAGPPAALIKAVLINAADDIGTDGIDFQTGYGKVNAFAAVKTIVEKHYLQGDVAAGERFVAIIPVPSARRLKITLVWTDPPGRLNSPKALVNDLDLTVFDGQTSWQPWVLNPFPHLDSLRKRPVRMRDTLNNVEQVTLDVSSPGSCTIRVNGSRIGSGRQAFAVAYQWDTPDTFYWTAPNAALPVVSDTTLTLRWKNTTTATYGKLEFSPDTGKSWVPVRDSVTLATGMLAWKTPAVFTTGRLRMRITDSLYLSDVFTLSPVPNPTVLYSCADSLGLRWITATGGQPVPLHNLYRLTKQADTWEKVGVIVGNQHVINQVQPGDLWAIAPVTATGDVGIRSEPISGSSVFCYYRSLTATLVDSLIDVRCELSAAEAVAAITFEKWTASGIRELATQSVTPLNTVYALTDSLLQEGPNTYRVRLLLKNGGVIYSNLATAFVLRKSPVLLYPNPVENGWELTVQAGQYGQFVLRLVDATGRIIREYAISGTEAILSTAGLSAGLYPYAIFRDDQRIQTGKLLVR